MTGEGLSISIILEWENAARVGLERSALTLRALHKQLVGVLAEQVGQAEIVLVFNFDLVPRQSLERLLQDAGPSWPCDLTFVPASQREYYALKMIGAAKARHDVLVFVDSDVTPRDGWLEALLDDLASGDFDLVGGTTVVELGGTYSKAMALGWIFPTAPREGGTEPAPSFFANNFAVRRDLFLAHPFRPEPTYRGQCGALAQRLAEQGFRIGRSRDAIVSHPPPAGVGAFAARALRGGYDAAARARSHGAGVPRALVEVAREGRVALARVWLFHRHVGLGAPGMVVAAMIVTAYRAIKLIGILFTAAAPRTASRLLLTKA